MADYIGGGGIEKKKVCGSGIGISGVFVGKMCILSLFFSLPSTLKILIRSQLSN